MKYVSYRLREINDFDLILIFDQKTHMVELDFFQIFCRIVLNLLGLKTNKVRSILGESK